jgi:hypothetical protein
MNPEAVQEAPPVEVELLGLARLLARREAAQVPVTGTTSLAQLARTLADQLPALVGTVVTEEGCLIGGHAFSRDGRELLRDPAELIHPGDRLLLLSTIAGGNMLFSS